MDHVFIGEYTKDEIQDLLDKCNELGIGQFIDGEEITEESLKNFFSYIVGKVIFVMSWDNEDKWLSVVDEESFGWFKNNDIDFDKSYRDFMNTNMKTLNEIFGYSDD